MDIQTRKLELIQAFLDIQSVELIALLERILKNKNNDLPPFSIPDFNERIKESLSNSENNEVTTSHDLLTEIKQWS